MDRAIEISKRTEVPLLIAAKVDRVDEQYFQRVIRPLLNHPLLTFIGEIGESQKEEFLGNAMALLVPVNWPEPFGLVMIEAMACGTPVLAFRRGSVPEVVDEGESGFVVEDVAEAIDAVEKVRQLDRWKCRQVFERRFTTCRMARDYVAVFKRLAAATIGRPARLQERGLWMRSFV